MTRYYLVGEVPVKLERRDDGSTVVSAFNRRTNRFEANSQYYSTIRRDDTGWVRAVSVDEFDAAVQRLQDLQVA